MIILAADYQTITLDTFYTIVVLLGTLCGGVWWLSALYRKVGDTAKAVEHLEDKSIADLRARVNRIASHLVSELGGRDDNGQFTVGNLRVATKEVRKEVERTQRAVSRHFVLKEGAVDPFDSAGAP